MTGSENTSSSSSSSSRNRSHHSCFIVSDVDLPVALDENHLAVVVEVKTSEIPPWIRLLAAPIACLLLGLWLSPKFLVLALIYALVTIKPVYCCVRLWKTTSGDSANNNNKSNSNNNVFPLFTSQRELQARAPAVLAQLDSALELHRSLTLQFAMLAVLLWLYELSRVLCSPTNNTVDEEHAVVHRAFDMARRLVVWEHRLKLAIEPGLQNFVWNHSRWLISLANAYYAVFHFVTPLGIMARLIVYNKDPRYEYRTGFFIMLFLALLLFTFVPTMPPRLMPSYKVEYIDAQPPVEYAVPLTAEEVSILEPYWSIIDTMKQGETLYDKLHKEGGNPYAAMPSMHTGWALWSCLTWIGTINDNASPRARTIQRTLAIMHVVCMVCVIIITGNHFWLDAVAGATCVVIGSAFAHRLIEWIAQENGVVSRPIIWLRHGQLGWIVAKLGMFSARKNNAINVTCPKRQGENELNDDELEDLILSSSSLRNGMTGIEVV